MSKIPTTSKSALVMLRIQKPTAEKNVDTILKRGGDQITVEQLTQFALW